MAMLIQAPPCLYLLTHCVDIVLEIVPLETELLRHCFVKVEKTDYLLF